MGGVVRVLVTGAGGFIGHHLVKRLKLEGHWVRGVDVKYPECEPGPADEFELLDLRRWDNCLLAVRGGIHQVYNLAAAMDGTGYSPAFDADIARNNILINTHMLEASRQLNVKRFLFSSSTCVYPRDRQQSGQGSRLREPDAYPANPQPGQGWAKLFSEELCKYYWQDYRFETRWARLQDVYGPLGIYEGGKEKAPAAISRKVALARNGDEIELCGDGQPRSFLYIEDCVEGLVRLMASNHREALNLGTNELVSIDRLADMVAAVSGKKLVKRHDESQLRGGSSGSIDNSLPAKVLGWEPQITLERGLAVTYRWIEGELRKAGRITAGRAQTVPV